MDVGTQLAKSHDISIKIGQILGKRTKTAQDHFNQRIKEALIGDSTGTLFQQFATSTPWSNFHYVLDAMQRSILFLDTLRERGNNFVEHVQSGLKPVLHFDYDIVLDARTFEHPVNYALLRIKPPAGVTIDPKKRPYLIIDPRAGHGPGIGGFKDDSQVGVALRAGHPVYFVIFFRDPEPGQTMLDVCAAEQQFVKKVRELHPDSRKPALIGNCQGGWAAMMLAASDADETGPVVINGAPMSYWGGAWSEGEGDNPMRYAGGILGGTWLASLFADLGNGVFDGAHLVQNFDNLNPANSLWDKYYHLYENIDTEPPRFLEFERWYGGFYLMNKEEIEWITQNLFIGNKLWSGDVKPANGQAFDLRAIKSPIILFSSLGDNITPPQQAFNWVSDTYRTTEEIKARGQVIVGLMHQSVGHLGIFVSGKVAKKEHAQIVSVLKSIEALAPGLYGMEIKEHKGNGGKVEYEVAFREYRLEDITAHFDRFKRVDEKPFEAVATLSEFNQRAYELFAQPLVKKMSNELSAKLMREFHPLRMQNWAWSDNFNPWLSWLGPTAQAVRAMREKPDANLPSSAPSNNFNPWMSWMAPAMHALKAGRETLDAGQPFPALPEQLNPWLSWLARAAQAANKNSAAVDAGQPFQAISNSLNQWQSWFAPAMQAFNASSAAPAAGSSLHQLEKISSELISASLDYYRAIRDAATEATFFAIYANMYSTYLAEKAQAEQSAEKIAGEPRELAFVKDALTSIADGGYAEAFARVAYMLSRRGEPLLLHRLEMRAELAETYAEYLPDIPIDEWRRVRGEQEIIVRYELEQALRTLPDLLSGRADRKRLLTLLDKLMADERVQNAQPTEEQLAMLERIRGVLTGQPKGHHPVRERPAPATVRSLH